MSLVVSTLLAYTAYGRVVPLENIFEDIEKVRHDYFDLGPYQVSESPKVWVFDGLLSDDALKAVNNSFAGKTQYGSWEIPKASNEIMDTLQILAHVDHPLLYQDMMYVAEYQPGYHQSAHMDRYSLSNYPDELLKTVNVSRLALVDEEANGFNEPSHDQAIPLYSFIVNFGNVGSTNFVGGEEETSIPAKANRIVMWQNYLEDGSVDHAALHHGIYPDVEDGKRILSAGAVADPLNQPNLRSNVASHGWLHFPLANHAGHKPEYKRKIGLSMM